MRIIQTLLVLLVFVATLFAKAPAQHRNQSRSKSPHFGSRKMKGKAKSARKPKKKSNPRFKSPRPQKKSAQHR